ncbi:MAG: tetratricopeptide repeat protein [Planctomycetota bacterium]
MIGTQNLTKLAAYCTIALIVATVTLSVRQGADAWSSPDRRGQRMLDSGQAVEAAKVFANPFRRGVAQFRAGQFKEAASTFAGLPGADATFNQANARVMLGEYDQAVKLYDRVLQESPDRKDAKQNREIAVGRAERLKDEGGEMTGGMLGADEIVFGEQSPGSGGEDVELDSESIGDEDTRKLWLRQVQTTPSDFLRTKFAFQQSRSDSTAEANRDQ